MRHIQIMLVVLVVSLAGAELAHGQWKRINNKVVLSHVGLKVGLGTTTVGPYRLNVKGTVRSNEIVVNTEGADFVFDKGYVLRPLSEVEAFIKVHGHLPDIPPAADMQRDGVEVGALQTRLLQKIEELTLYLLHQDQKLRTLQRENDALSARVALLLHDAQ